METKSEVGTTTVSYSFTHTLSGGQERTYFALCLETADCHANHSSSSRGNSRAIFPTNARAHSLRCCVITHTPLTPHVLPQNYDGSRSLRHLPGAGTYLRAHAHAPHTRTSTHSNDLHHIDYSNIFLSPKKSTAVYLLEILTCLLLCCLLPTTTSVDVDTFGEEAVFETANQIRDEVLQVRVCKT